ncbi:sensor histidine kinase [Nocardia cyriacigeorgica]|nr:sensor histidine kinase [Nocardia cyriacigeorgica]
MFGHPMHASPPSRTAALNPGRLNALSAEGAAAASVWRYCRSRSVTVAADAPAPVRGRPKALARCVDNLIGNAIKFSPAGTPIIVHIHGTELAVHDQGPGIDPSETTAVFGRFYRAEGTQAIPGSGLGLAIVDDIVTAHHGTVFAEPGPGARIGFRLPPISP